MNATTADLARNLIAAWLPWLTIAAFMTAAVWTFRKVIAWTAAERRAAEDAAADAEWADILAAVGLTPQDMRARWRQQEAANRAALETTRREIAALPTTEQP